MVTIRDGLNRKDLRNPVPEWYRNQIRKCFNEPEIRKLMDKIKQDSPKDAINILISTLPKEQRLEMASTFRLVLEGMPAKPKQSLPDDPEYLQLPESTE